MKYDIKAIPTTYGGSNFRSRLEARWAAFFDLVGIEWEYEPFDLDGWAPDFRIMTPTAGLVHPSRPVLVEVKPIDLESKSLRYDNSGSDADLFAFEGSYQKAMKHAFKHYVMLCGVAPMNAAMGYLLSPPSGSSDEWQQVFDQILVFTKRQSKMTDYWREAGNAVQWMAP